MEFAATEKMSEFMSDLKMKYTNVSRETILWQKQLTKLRKQHPARVDTTEKNTLKASLNWLKGAKNELKRSKSRLK